MPYREECPVVLQRIEDGWTWTARCCRPEGHEGGHLSDLTRVELRWATEATDGMAEGEQAGEPRQAVAAHGGAGHRS